MGRRPVAVVLPVVNTQSDKAFKPAAATLLVTDAKWVINHLK